MMRGFIKQIAALGLLLFAILSSAAPADATSRYGLALRVFQNRSATIPFTQTIEFMNRTKQLAGAASLNYTGAGTLSVQSQTCDGTTPGNSWTVVGSGASQSLALAGTANTLNTLGSPSSCSIVVSDEFGATSHVTVNLICCGFSVASFLETKNAFGSSQVHYGDIVRARAGSYSVSNGDTISRDFDWATGPNGETAPTTRAGTGWVTLEPDPGATVTFVGNFGVTATAGRPELYIKIHGIKFYTGTVSYLGTTRGALQLKATAGGITMKYLWVDGNEIYSSFDQTRWDADNIACGCTNAVTSYIGTAVYQAAGSPVQYAWFTDNYVHTSYDGITWSGFNLKFIGNRFEGQYRDTINGAKLNCEVSFNEITDKSAVHGSHGDYYQESFNNWDGTYTGCILVGNRYWTGYGDGTPPGQVLRTNTATGSTAQVVIVGTKYYGNFVQGEHVSEGAWSNCRDCIARWNTNVYGAQGLTSNAMTIAMKTFYASGYTGSTDVTPSGNYANYNVTRLVSIDGAADTTNNYTYSSSISSIYPVMFDDPDRSATDDVSEIMRRWNPKSGGPLVPGGTDGTFTNSTGYYLGAFSPYVDHDARTADFPDGFSYDANVD